MKIHPLSRTTLEQLTSRGTVLERDDHGVKVLVLPDGNFLKYFRRKRLLSRDLLAPAALRFAINVRRLHALGVPVMRVLALHRIIGEAHTVVIYQPLAGESLRKLLATESVDAAQMRRVGSFIAHLHSLGIYFRSLHPGNIVIDGETPGLIDVLDLRMRAWSLTRWERHRNWLHFLRCEEDRPWLRGDLIDALLAGYHETSELSEVRFSRMSALVRSRLGFGQV
jgi:tRNA A-37 threonylcarbamoyl transferase component Bud32